MTDAAIVVVDIGKTNSKLVRVDPGTLETLEALRAPTPHSQAGLYPHYDTDLLWAWLVEGLGKFARAGPVGTISITTHGAAAAIVDADGLVLPVLDYEHDGPEQVAGAYAGLRPPFEETLSPALPTGLNLGRQIYWQSRTFARDFGRAVAILPYPQYWAWRLCGVAAADVSSLGCHTDLWNPRAGTLSSLAVGEGWDRLIPAVRAPWEALAAVRPELREQTGLPADCRVLTGIHDSNASLFPHLSSREAPFAVVSTGTWAITFAVGGDAGRLDAARDCLAYVDAFGRAVPGARFMGGREWEQLTGSASEGGPPGEVVSGEAALAAVAAEGIMIRPGRVPGVGPYPHTSPGWSAPPESLAAPQRRAAASLYLAEMTATCLELAGAAGETIIEGPFAENLAYCRALAEITGRPVQPMANAGGTTLGAALLALPPERRRAPEPALPALRPGELPALREAFAAWQRWVEQA